MNSSAPQVEETRKPKLFSSPLASSLTQATASARGINEKHVFDFASTGANFSAAGAIYEIKVGSVDGELQCQFVLVCSAWASQGSGDLDKSALPKLHTAAVVPKQGFRGALSSTRETPVAGSPQGGLPLSFTAQKAAKQQFVVRCCGSEKFVIQIKESLVNGVLAEVSGAVMIHDEHLLNTGVKQHAEIRLTREGLRSGRHALRILHSTSPIGASGLQERISCAIYEQ